MSPARSAVLAIAITLAGAGALAAQHRIPLRTGWRFAPETEPGQRPAGGWRQVGLPHTFEDQLGPEFDGAAWYARTLELAPEWRERVIRVEFTAAATRATVYLNGERVGSHLGGWTPFRIALDGARCDGTDLLEVHVDELVGHNTQGFLPIIQPHFGGIWQEVTLCVDGHPMLDRLDPFAFGDLEHGLLRSDIGVLGGPAGGDVEVEVRLLDGSRAVATAAVRTTVAAGSAARAELLQPVDSPRGWSPGAPHLYGVEFVLRDAAAGTVLDTLRTRAGFRHVARRGSTLTWNGAPLQVRGMLHWGFEPPGFAPNLDSDHWRRELEDLRALGCNLVKACLWVPPRAFFDVADELGMLVWQEYPTWHPQLTADHRDDLLAEFDEFYRHDRSHVSTAIRSLTCETGHGADLDILRSLYERAHERVPQTLVIDDSSWISWSRVHDFYDDHPYGNNSWWPGKLASFREFVAEREPMPLLFGECMAADTWFDEPAWRDRTRGADLWYAPLCLEDQRAVVPWIEREFGAETLAALRPVSLAYGLRNRKYQIERLRLSIPDAGYVLSVIRDFPKARMGFYDDLGALKWSPEQWAWHRDTMLCLDSDGDRRAFAGEAVLPVRVSHYGRGPLAGTLALRLHGDAEHEAAATAAVQLDPGTVSAPVVLRAPVDVAQPRRVRVTARLDGSHPAASSWDVWLLPAADARATPEVRTVERLDREVLAALRDGARVLLLAGPQKRSLKTHDIWFLRGAPFAPPHPIHERVPAELLLELQSFDLERPRVLHWQHLIDQVDPILAFWDTHDASTVNRWLFAFDCRVGRGRLLVTALNHDTPAGRWLLGELRRHLATGPAPKRALRPATIAALEGVLAADVVDLPRWELRTDPADEGLAAGWQRGEEPAGGWREVEAGRHWESQGFEHYDGVAWYRTALDVPADWAGKTVHAVFEGVDDSYRLYVNGDEAARFGDPATGETVWLIRTTADIGPFLHPGERNRIVLRVVDHTGAGGLHRPVFVTTGPIDASSELLH